MTPATGPGHDAMRVVAQFLEGGAASAAISPDAAAACLRRACAIVPITDVCLGWRLPPALVEAVTTEARAGGVRVWLWQPLLSGDGSFVPGQDAARGRLGTAVPSPGNQSEFTFDCAVRPQGRAAALERLDEAVAQTAWDGVFLDKIRWPSPTRDPAEDLACFCDACHEAAAADDVDLASVAEHLARYAATAEGRIELLAQILGVTGEGPLKHFMAWRCDMITSAVREAAQHVAAASAPGGGPPRVALDVFTPSLARAVGQDIAALAPFGDFTKSMTYLGTHGPAGMPYELCRLARWLDDGGVSHPAERLGEMLGLTLGPEEQLCQGRLGAAVVARELRALMALAGEGSALGIDAVELPDLAVLDDETLREAVGIVVAAGGGLVLAWDLWAIPPRRLGSVASALSADAPRASHIAAADGALA